MPALFMWRRTAPSSAATEPRSPRSSAASTCGAATPSPQAHPVGVDPELAQPVDGDGARARVARQQPQAEVGEAAAGDRRAAVPRGREDRVEVVAQQRRETLAPGEDVAALGGGATGRP